MQLLDGYDELVAAVLRAVHGIRLLAGTGILRKTGRRLVIQQKRKANHAEKKEQSPQRIAAAEARREQAQAYSLGPAVDAAP